MTGVVEIAFVIIHSERKFTLSNQTILLNEPRSLITLNKIWLNQVEFFFDQIISKQNIFGWMKQIL